MNYDIIGDIHGHFDKLETLLKRLGYRHARGAWRHAERQAIFIGDFSDRGEQGVEVVQTVRAMVDAGSARAVMGNHEFNAVAWHTPNPAEPGEYLRPRHSGARGARNRHQHQAFLKQVEANPALHREMTDWFLTLPLWIDEAGLRVVHACWHEPFMRWLSPRLRDGRFLTRELMVDASAEPADEAEKDSPAPSTFKAVEALTKGIEIPLPEPHSFQDKDGQVRRRVRARWWDGTAATFRQIAHMPETERLALPDMEVPTQARLPLAEDQATFFGHYWMTGVPAPQTPAAACVDYSAGKGGPLVAYRWDGGGPLSARQFAWVG